MRLQDTASPPRPVTFGTIIRSFDVLDSTNTTAKELVHEGAPEGMVVIAEEQRAGRGRLGRAWESEKGKNLTFSVILRPRVSPALIGLIPLLAGAAVCETLREEYHLPAECKWPNDVLLAGRKVCGVLSEALQQGDAAAVIVGIGVNINQSSFPAELHSSATSLLLESGREHDREAVLLRLLTRMESLYGMLLAGDAEGIVARWQGVSPIIGKSLRVTEGSTIREGIARGIAPDGALLLETAAGILTVRAGDVTLR